jgi:hypothetical protein
VLDVMVVPVQWHDAVDGDGDDDVDWQLDVRRHVVVVVGLDEQLVVEPPNESGHSYVSVQRLLVVQFDVEDSFGDWRAPQLI